MIKRELLLLLCLAFQAARLCEAVENRECLLRYQWKPLTTCRYDLHVREAGAGTEELLWPMDVNVVSAEGGDALVSVSFPMLTNSNYVCFFSINETGEMKCLKIAVEQASRGKALTEWSAIREPRHLLAYLDAFYGQQFWGLPEKTISPGAGRTVGDYVYQIEDYNDIESLCVIKVFPHDVTRNKLVQTRKYDSRRGILLNQSVRRSDSAYQWELALRLVEPLPDDTERALKTQYDTALDLDEFRETMFMPFLKSDDSNIKRLAYGELFSVKGGSRLSELCRQFMKNEKDPYFQNLVQIFFSSEVKDGKQWAIRMLLEDPIIEDFNKSIQESNRGVTLDETTFGLLESLSGMSFGRDRAKWLTWYSIIISTFPEFTSTPSSQLMIEISNMNPWIRLFALKQLSERENVDLMPILDKALNDDDENVRTFAEKKIKELKAAGKETE